ncbi:MAG: helix-turn-helix transcriptional regulator [Limnochordia bacterium]|jgi:putative transcriptional regulator|nr:helix-turn-helix transcriptional regulator [Limnochordia bacterium]
MAIRVNLDRVMLENRKSLTQLAQDIDITMSNLSILKNNRAKAIRFSTLDALCKELRCQPGDILEFIPDGSPDGSLE